MQPIQGPDKPLLARAAPLPPLALLGLAALLALAAAAALAGPSSAQTFVAAGNLTANATWDSSGSPYAVAGDVVVPPGITLTVLAGTQVDLPSLAHLYIEGRLDVQGTLASPVNFYPASGSLSFGGLQVNRSGTASLLNASVLGADAGLVVGSSLSVTVVDSSFAAIGTDAVRVTGNSTGTSLLRVTINAATTGVALADGDLHFAADGLVVNTSAGCLSASSASNITLINPTFIGCAFFGATFSLSSDISVSGAQFINWSSSTSAFAAASCTRLNLTRSAFTTVAADLPAVDLEGLADSVVADNVLRFNFPAAGTELLNPPIALRDLAPVGENRIERNTVAGFYIGIQVASAIFPQVVDGNTVQAGPDTGIEILDSPNQTVRGNTITGRLFPFAVNVTSPNTPWYYREYLDANNTVDGRPILYMLDGANATLDLEGGAGIVAIVDSDNITLRHANLTRGMPSLLVVGSRNVTAEDSAVQSNMSGVFVFLSFQVTLSNLSIDGGLTCLALRDGAANVVSVLSTTNCTQAVLTQGRERDLVISGISVNGTGRIALFEGVNITLADSVLTQAAEIAVSNVEQTLGRGGQSVVTLGHPDGVTLRNVTIEAAREAVVLSDTGSFSLYNVTIFQSTRGIVLSNVTAFLLVGSQVSGLAYAVLADNLTDSRVYNSTFGGASLEGFFCMDCRNVSFHGNYFTGNSVGLAFLGGSGCLISQNSFFFNTLHATADSAVQDFDNGTIGNLWDDYQGLDADNDGIGDTPYIIASGVDEDRYPIARFPDAVPPHADAGPDIVTYEDAPVLLSGYLSTDDVGIRAYLWTFRDAGGNATVAGISVRYWFYTPGVYLITLTVIDWGGNRDSDTLVVTVLDRTPPHADAGGDRTVDEDTVVALDASRSFDNDPRFPAGAAFTWYVADTNGTAVLFGESSAWVFATPGNFTVTLFVDDPSGYSDKDTVRIRVRDRTPPVVPPLEAPLATEDAPFRVYGSAPTDNDPNWPAGMTSWFELWTGGLRVALTYASPAVFNVSEPGVYLVVFYVEDASLNIGSANVTFPVADVTPPDVSQFGDRQAEAGVPVAFDVSPALDNDPAFPAGANATWTVSVPSGRVTLYGLNTTFAFPAVGDFAVSLHLRDAGGNLAETSFTVHVRDTQAPLVTLSGPRSVEAGSLATFEANATDATDLSEFMWTVEGSGPRFGPQLNIRFFTPGTFEVTVHVEDRLGHGTNASLIVDVVDTTAPTILLDLQPLPRGGEVNLTLTEALQAAFLGTDNSGVVSVEWAWGDGEVSNGSTAAHTYGAAGNYTVLVRVADGAGNANTTSFHVRVEAPPPPPPPPPTPSNATLPTAAQFPTLAVAALLALGVGGGVAIGVFASRRGRAPPEKEP